MTVKDRQCLLTFLKKADGTSYYTGDVDGISGPLSRKAIQDFQKDFCGLTVTGEADAVTDQAMIHAVAFGIPERDPEAESDAADKNVGDNFAEDNNVPSKTGTFWDEIEYFDREEFRCQCNGKYCNGFHVEPEETMVRLCDEIRRRAGVPILIRDAGGSGLRCPQHNASIPGAATNSEHIYGRAADLHPRGKPPAQLHAIAEEVMAEMIPGRGGLGLYSWGIHVDTGKYSRWDSRG